MFFPIRLLRFSLAAVVLFAGPGFNPAFAQIRLGQSVDLTGVTSPFSRDFILGMKAHLKEFNSAGGVKGQAVELVTLDDQFDPEKTLANTRQLIADTAVVGLIGYRGTLNLQNVMPVLSASRIALIGTSAGSMSLRKPLHPYLFHTRASLADEIEVLVNHATRNGLRQIAVGYQDDAFGKEGMAAFDAAMLAKGLTSVAIGAVPRGTVDVDAAATTIAAANPEVLIFIGQSKPAAALIAALRERKRTPQIMVTSIVASIYDELGDAATGIIVSQVVPLPTRVGSTRIVREYQTAMQAIGESKFAHSSFEGYLIARIATRGLGAAGAKPTREAFRKALEAIKIEDIGGFPIEYSASSHLGSRFVDITMIRKNGDFAN